MRGMIEGVWHAELDQAAGWSDDLAATFATPAARAPFDMARLADAPDSFHLYAALACPFAHRALLARAILGIESLPVTLADPWLGGPSGWHFPVDTQGPVHGATTLWQIYAANAPQYTGRVTVPVLWDREAGAIVSAESDEILLALVNAFAGRGHIDIATEGASLHGLCDWIKDRINLGVYRIGFSRSQEEYDGAHKAFLEALSQLEERLGGAMYLWNDALSIADILLFPTAVRFDAAYHGAFQIYDIRWRDFPRLQAHMERIAGIPGVTGTVAPDDYRRHYFDDGIFPIRHPGSDGHYVVPRTPEPY